MKFHMLYIGVAIGLIHSSCQAAPLLGNVADITSDRLDVPAGGVHADSEGVHLHQDQDKGTSLLQKRSPLLNNQGVNSVSGGDGGASAGLLSELLTKRQKDLDGTAGTLASVTNPVERLVRSVNKKRDESNDDDGDDLLKQIPPPGAATYGSGMAAANQPSQEALMDAMTKRHESNDDDGDDVFKHFPPPGATYGSGMAANRPSQEALMDAMTKRGEEEEGGEDTDDASSNGENTQDRPGPPPPGLTDEQLDDFFTKR